MAKILITSGPTRQHIDAVRYLTNASSGRMGRGLAAAAIDAGHQVTVVSGPVEVEYPAEARVVPVVSTEEMLAAAGEEFAACDGAFDDHRPTSAALILQGRTNLCAQRTCPSHFSMQVWQNALDQGVPQNAAQGKQG